MKFVMDLAREPFCRPLCRLLLKQDRADGGFYLGVTPDGANPGRLGVTRLSLCRGEEELPFTVSEKNCLLRLEAENAWVELALALPNRLLIRGRGAALRFGNGKGAGVFMGGGSAVQDAYNPGGALLAMSGCKLRFIPVKGSIEARSAWDLNTLTDPNPAVILWPDENGELSSVLYESDYDEPCPADNITLEEAAAEMEREFATFLETIRLPSEEPIFLRAAYAVWTALQPDRDLADRKMLAPEYIAGREAEGIAYLSDNVLLSLLFKERETALARLCSFLKYIQPDGMIPRTVNNRGLTMESELPLFGLALRELPAGPVPEECYQAMKKAVGWWKTERFCPERGLYYYLHRYEPACCKRLPFADMPPEFAPDLNAVMLLWLDQMAVLAGSLGKTGEQTAWTAEADALLAALNSRLWNGERFLFGNIEDKPVCEGHPRALLPALLGDRLPRECLVALCDAIPTEAGEDAVFHALALRDRDGEKLRALADRVREQAEALDFMTVRQALTLLICCAACEGRD